MSRRALLFVTALATLGLPRSALAWNWDSGYAPSGDSLTWHLCDNDFTANEESEITWAADGWDAGSGEAMRGAIWDFVRGSDHSSGCARDNNEDEVYMEDATWFTIVGYGASKAVCFCDDGDGLDDRDIVFKSSVSWTTLVPSAAADTDTSIGQVALHEFGHLLGFLHDNTKIATMNPGGSAPNSGDISGHKYRPHEDDYVGLTVNRPDSSTGRNLMLGRFVEDGDQDGWEVWTSPSPSPWTVCDGIVNSPSGPDRIYGIIHGTACQDPVVKWWLSADTTCNWGSPDYLVGTKTPHLCSGTPYLLHPDPYDFRGVPPDDYYLCAYIDPADVISETNAGDSDNDLRSEGLVTVQDCP